MAAKHGLHAIPKLIEIIAALPEQYRDRLAPFLRSKPVRSASGVAVVAVMCKPHRCPHLAFTGAVCAYCEWPSTPPHPLVLLALLPPFFLIAGGWRQSIA